MRRMLTPFVLLGLAVAGCNNKKTPDTCRQSVAQYCAAAPSCAWSAFADPTSQLCDVTLLDTACGPYEVAIQHGIDSGTTFYFDPATGMLVAAVDYGFGTDPNAPCAAGPSEGFDPPNCPTSAFVPACPNGPLNDAGAND